jgi:hypothetical protein
MDRTTMATSTHPVPAWLVRCCRWLTRGYRWLWLSFFNIFLSLIATWLFTASDSKFSAFPITTFLQHWLITAASLSIFVLLTSLVWAIGKLPIIESPRALKRQYLAYWTYQTQDLAIEGIPLIPPRVHLDEIFIAMQLRPYLSYIDQLLSEEQSKLLHEDVQYGRVAPEVERVLIDAEHQYESFLRKNARRIEIEDLWQQLTKEHPAAVIQGYPGMGKSTLLLRLTLYMARRGRGLADPLKKPITPLMIPLFIRLGRYAAYCQQAKRAESDPHPSIWKYLASSPKEMAELTTPAMLAWLQDRLEHGECLVLFDGLDEVSELGERCEVQEALKAFIAGTNSKASGAKNYNRFLITSRVAGYDQSAFPGYPHYTIAELTQEQIEMFLPRWCRACVQGDLLGFSREEVEQQVTRQATAIEEKLKIGIQSHQGISTLVENPFLLTLLAIMQQNGMALPHRRVDLYSKVTTILLETRNDRRNLPPIPEAQAIQRLGPVAYRMQGMNNDFMTSHNVLSSFAETIEQIEKILPEQARKEAEAFLQRIRERGGIFVFRTGDFLGFFHRTFQEYFTARYLLRLLETHVLTKEELLDKARQQGELWREPFLLAVAYKTRDEASVAWEIMRDLLSLPSGADQKRRAHDILLAGECLVEAREATIPSELERDIMRTLLELYEEALEGKDSETCEQVEDLLRRLLSGISNEAAHSPLLLTMQETLLAPEYPRRLRVTLTLLTLIAHDLRPCANVVFTKLVPPLLGLAQLPEVGSYQPIQPKVQPDLNNADLACAVLCFMGTHGPSGASFNHLLPRFESHLNELAHHSLQSGFLITPAVVPFDQKRRHRYIEGIELWQQMYEQARASKGPPEQNISTCTKIHRDLLAAAEDVCYPAATHLSSMLERSLARSGEDWQIIWQDYLREQMNTETYLDYQTSALLWATLWPAPPGIGELASVLLDHFSSSTKPQRYAQRFLCSIVNDVRDLSYVSNFQDLVNASPLSAMANMGDDVRYPRYVQYVGKMGFSLKDANNQYREHMSYLNDLRQSKYSGNLSKLRHWSPLRYQSYLSYWGYLKDVVISNDSTTRSDVRYARCLRQLCTVLFTEPTRREAERRLPTCVEAERIELLLILLGRILSIREDEKRDQKTEQEIRHIVQVIWPFVSAGCEERELLLDMLRFLPACTEQEIVYMLDLAKNTQDDEIQKACAYAIRSCKPATNEAWALLEQARTLSIPVICEAVEWRLEQ